MGGSCRHFLRRADVIYDRPMDVVVVGGHGKIAMRLLRLLAERGDRARGVIRKPEQAADLEELGAEAVVCDIESEDLTEAVEGADAVVFAAGAGPGSGPIASAPSTWVGPMKLIEAAKANGVSRYVIVSSIGAHDPSRRRGGLPHLPRGQARGRRGGRRERARLHDRPAREPDRRPRHREVDVRTELGPWRGPRDDVAAVLAEALAPMRRSARSSSCSRRHAGRRGSARGRARSPPAEELDLDRRRRPRSRRAR